MIPFSFLSSKAFARSDSEYGRKKALLCIDHALNMLQQWDIPLDNDDRQEIDGIRAIYRALGGNDLEKRHLLRHFSTAGTRAESEVVSGSPEPPVRRKTLNFDAITVDLIEEEVRKALHAVGGKGRNSASVVPGDIPGDYFAFNVLVAEVSSV